MTDDPQATLFPSSGAAEGDAPLLNAEASLQAALGHFETHMRNEGFAVNTVKAFISDIRLLGKYLGIGQPVGAIGTNDLNNFLNWLLYERKAPCSPKSYARRVTTLKVFFGWLNDINVLISNPAAGVIQRSVSSPLPSVPTPTQLERARAVTGAWYEGEEIRKPDARPHLLLTLLLQTGIKKGEAMGIVPNHIDRSDPDAPFLFVRYKNPRLRYKERKIDLDPAWLEILDAYLEQYEPTDTLFTCTARNLEYILSDVAEAAHLDKSLLSFENLRWAAALADLRDGVDEDEIRQKLGLSKVTWRETMKKLEKLREREIREESSA
jgi:integrase/recombinase XerD